MNKLVKDTILQLRQNNISNETDHNLKIIISKMNNLISEIEDINMEDANQIIDPIRDLLEAYQSGDIIYLADVLEYELLDLIEYCR